MAFDADALAARWLEAGGGAPVPAALNDAQRVALGWALKSRGYSYTDRALAQRCRDAVQALSMQTQAHDAKKELEALADWLGGANDALQGQAVQAVQRLSAAHEAFVALDRPHEAASVLVPKIIALSTLAQHDAALDCATQALRTFVALKDDLAAGKVDINLGSMLLRRYRYEEAAGHYRAAAVRLARAKDAHHSVMADIGLAGCLCWQLNFDEAQLIYERASARVRAHDLFHLQGVIDSNRGMLELRRGRHAEALRWLQAAMQRAESTEGAPRRAAVRSELAEAYLALNLLPEARSLFAQSLDGLRGLGDTVEEAAVAAQLAVTLARMDEERGALDQLALASGLFDAQGNQVGAAWLESLSAMVNLRAGRVERALVQAETAVPVLQASGMRGWWLDARTLVAQALSASDRRDEAWQRFQDVIDEAPDAPELVARCLTGQAELMLRRDDRAGARAKLELAASTIERQQSSLQGDEFRTAYLADKQSAYDALIALELDDARPGAASRLLASMERARARALSLGLARRDEPAGVDAQQASTRERLHWLQQQWQHAVASGDTDRATTLQRRAREFEQQVLEAHRRAQAATVQNSDSATTARFSVAALQAALPADGALVAYAWVGERLAVVVVRPQTLHHAALDAKGLEGRIEQLRFQINSLRFGAPALRQHSRQMVARAQTHLQALHRQVWAPIVDWLGGAEQLVVVPHRAMHYLPFCALHDGEHALLDRHALSLAPSAALWQAQQGAPRRPLQRAVVVGMGGAQLPHVHAEVAQVADVFAGQATTLRDEHAVLGALRQSVENGADLLHLACHGQFRADSPYFSSLELADGPLTLRDAAALPLSGTMITLSACETGLSRIAPGDEMVGLVRGFLMAGAPTVLSTLWTVDDAGTAELMGSFYRALRAGGSAAQALRQAQLAVRETRAHPYFWAPFALHGRVS
jgi:CHAT domain-containing protein